MASAPLATISITFVHNDRLIFEALLDCANSGALQASSTLAYRSRHRCDAGLICAAQNGLAFSNSSAYIARMLWRVRHSAASRTSDGMF